MFVIKAFSDYEHEIQLYETDTVSVVKGGEAIITNHNSISGFVNFRSSDGLHYHLYCGNAKEASEDSGLECGYVFRRIIIEDANGGREIINHFDTE